MTATAQETYREMIKTQLAPGLRALGFKGSGKGYDLPSAEFWSVLGLQGSRASDANEVRFTVNLLVVSREAWERARLERSYLRERPNANQDPGTFVWWERLGSLMPGGEDTWWRVGAGKPTDEIARQVLHAVEAYGLPALRAQMTD